MEDEKIISQDMSAPLVDLGGHAVNIGRNSSIEPPLTQDSTTILLETIAAIIAFYCAFLSLSSKTTSPKFLNDWNISRNLGLDVANKLLSSCFAILSSTSGIFVLLTYGTDYYWGQIITYIMPIGMGYFLYDTYAMFIVYQSNQDFNANTKSKDEPKKNKKSFKSFVCYQPLIVAHHLLLAFFFIPLMVNRRDHPGGDPMLACALIMESSTPFVSMRAILYNLNLRQSWIYVLNGLLMVIVFFLCRIAVYPWFYCVHAKANDLTPMEAVITTPPRCGLWMILVLLLQLYWFKIMLNGAVKVVMEKVNQNKLQQQQQRTNKNHSETSTKED